MAEIKAIKYLGWKFLRIPHDAKENEPLSWAGGFEGATGGGLSLNTAKDLFINADAALYTVTSLSSLFASSNAKLAKVYNESKMPTTGAYTVFSLGWTYTDSENAPALLAVQLSTGKLFYYQGTESNCKADAWQAFAFGDGNDDGLRGDYCSQYGIVQWSGVPTVATGNKVNVPGGIVANVPGTVAQPEQTLITLASPVTISLTKTTNSILAYVQGLDDPYTQCDKICFSKTIPADDDSTCQLWWNGEEMKFRSTDAGNVWLPTRVIILGKLIFTNGVLTRIDRTGWYHYLPESTAA